MKKYFPYDPYNPVAVEGEEHTIVHGEIRLDHVPLEGSLEIRGFRPAQSAAQLQSNEFYCNYRADTLYREANRIVYFWAGRSGQKVYASYQAVASPVTADDMNEIDERITSNEKRLDGHDSDFTSVKNNLTATREEARIQLNTHNTSRDAHGDIRNLIEKEAIIRADANANLQNQINTTHNQQLKAGHGISIVNDSINVTLKMPDSYTLPTASTTQKGGVKIGDGLQMDGETLNVTLQTAEPVDLSGIERDISNITASVSSAGININQLQTNVGQLQTSVGQLQTNTNQLQTSVSQLDAKITTIQSGTATPNFNQKITIGGGALATNTTIDFTNSTLAGNFKMSGSPSLSSSLQGNFTVPGNVTFTGSPSLSTSSSLRGDFKIPGNVSLSGSPSLSSSSSLRGDFKIPGSVTFTGSPSLSTSSSLKGDFKIPGNVSLSGNPTLSGNAVFTGGADFRGPVTLSGLLNSDVAENVSRYFSNESISVVENFFDVASDFADTVIAGVGGKFIPAVNTMRGILDNKDNFNALANKYLLAKNNQADVVTSSIINTFLGRETTISLDGDDGKHSLKSSLGNYSVSLTSDTSSTTYDYAIVKLSESSGFLKREGVIENKWIGARYIIPFKVASSGSVSLGSATSIQSAAPSGGDLNWNMIRSIYDPNHILFFTQTRNAAWDSTFRYTTISFNGITGALTRVKSLTTIGTLHDDSDKYAGNTETHCSALDTFLDVEQRTYNSSGTITAVKKINIIHHGIKQSEPLEYTYYNESNGNVTVDKPGLAAYFTAYDKFFLSKNRETCYVVRGLHSANTLAQLKACKVFFFDFNTPMLIETNLTLQNVIDDLLL